MSLIEMSDADLMAALSTPAPNPQAQQLQPYLNHPNVRNFLDIVSKAEGTDKNGYQTAFGGGLIDNLNDHPRKLYDFTQTDGKLNKTSAAGKYQFLQGTWDDVSNKLGLKDFGPESQDMGAIELMRRNGSLDDVMKGDYHSAIKKSGSTWASLPSSPYAQPKRTAGFIEGIVNSIVPSAQAQGMTDYSKLSNEELMSQLGNNNAQNSPNLANINDADLIKMLGADPSAQKAPASNLKPTVTNSAPVGNAANGGFIDAVGMGARDPIDALAQMLRRGVPEGVGNAVDGAGNWLADKGFPIARSNGVAGMDQQINDRNSQYELDRSAAGRGGFDAGRLIGNLLGSAPLMAIAPGGGATSLIGRMGAGAVQGGAFGTLNPVFGEKDQSNFWDAKKDQAITGAEWGAATPLVTGAISRVISPKASVDPRVQLLRSEGVELTPGQTLGGTASKVEDKLMSVPILGDAIRYARTKGNDQLNRAVYNRVLDPIGKTTDKVGREAVDDVSRQVSQAYDDVLGKVTFSPDAAFSQSLANLRNMAQSGLPGKEARQFTSELNRNVIEPLTKGKSIDGQAFKDIETQLGNRASAYLKSTDVYQNDVGHALTEVQKALRENLMRLNPSHAKELSSVNESFANLTRLQNAAGKINAEGGVFTPAQLAQAVRQGDRTVRKNSYARGNALMQDLSDAARDRMMATIPNSGTADRLMLNAGALGSGLYNPAIPAGLAAASIPYLPGISKAFTGAIANRPEKAQILAEQIRKLPAGFMGLLAK